MLKKKNQKVEKFSKSFEKIQKKENLEKKKVSRKKKIFKKKIQKKSSKKSFEKKSLKKLWKNTKNKYA